MATPAPPSTSSCSRHGPATKQSFREHHGLQCHASTNLKERQNAHAEEEPAGFGPSVTREGEGEEARGGRKARSLSWSSRIN
uniref:Uncharacterized protein n=1 Tax=Arundo donax TaxID=35708 RepID=A0A0A9B5Z4_ARUDO